LGYFVCQVQTLVTSAKIAGLRCWRRRTLGGT
jgi:hypothetical protein